MAAVLYKRMSKNFTQESVRALFTQPSLVSSLSQRMLSLVTPIKTSKSDSLNSNSSKSSQLHIHQRLMASSTAGLPGASSDTVLVVKSQAYNLLNRKSHAFKYILGETLGPETRNVEFKLGSGLYIQNQLGKHVLKYMCAFLNTEGGKLIIGVADSGEVKGVEIARGKEDSVRLRIDSAVKLIRPEVMPDHYSVKFVQVTDKNGHPIENLKVLEVMVRRGTASSLYETHQGDVYIRRDGSVQGPLKASAIQEWTRIQIKREERKRARHQQTETDANNTAISEKHPRLERGTNTTSSKVSLQSTALELVTCQQQVIRRLERENDSLRNQLTARRGRTVSRACSIL